MWTSCRLRSDESEIMADRTGETTDLLQGKKLWVNSNSSAAKSGLKNIAPYATAIWVINSVDEVRKASQAAGDAVIVLALYNIPHRDCGQYSAGGASSNSAYLQFVDSVANAIGKGNAIVILEPDALALNCAPQLAETLAKAVSSLKAQANTRVYIDIGHGSSFPPLKDAISRLVAANIEGADGFALNVSNYQSTPEMLQRGQDIVSGLRQQIGKDAHYVIDTSRNGSGPASGDAWCNPKGRSLGIAPTLDTNHDLVDAFLWVKTPGESDGDCGRGEPAAGQWNSAIASELNAKPPASVPISASAKIVKKEVNKAKPQAHCSDYDLKDGELGCIWQDSWKCVGGTILFQSIGCD